METSVPTSFVCAGCGAPFTPSLVGQTLCDRCQGLDTPEPPASPLQQADVSGYRLLHEIGAGRFATSWLAEDPQGHRVVLKLLRRYAPDQATVQRFIAEAQRIAAAPELVHPHLARLENGGVHLVQAFFLVYAAGGETTLADELRSRGRLLAARALEICAQLAEGLAAMHRAGIVHLDLKPANVGLTKAADGSDRALLLDFATSHLLASSGLEEPDSLPLSTAAYFAPETQKDARSDVYALGALLFHLVTGRVPVMGSTAEELLAAHRDHPPLRLRDAGRRVHGQLEELVARLLAKDPAQRPTIDEVPVLMRSIAPVADAARVDEHDTSVEDPLPVVEAFAHEPVPTPPPMPYVRPSIDPALERAMLGEVPAQPSEKASGSPSWLRFFWPTWIATGALAACVVALTIFAFVAVRPHAKPVDTAPPARAPVASPAMRVEDPARTPPQLQPVQSPQPPPAPTTNRSRYAKSFDRAQRALWTGKPASAEAILKDLLRKRKLSAADRAHAFRMLGDANAKKGDKPAAVIWYRKALRASEDPAERDKVQRALQQLRG